MHAPAIRRKTAALVRTTVPIRTAGIARTAVLAMLAAVAVTGVGAGPALAEEGDVTWTVRTASNSYGADRSSFNYAINPGGDVDDAMVVANRGTAPLNLAVYAADGYTTETGQLDLLTKEKKSVGIGAWVHSGQQSVAVQPGKTTQIPFTVAIPKNATPGDYVGGIITSLTQPDTAQGINVDRRLGIRIKLRVGGELQPSLAIENLRVEYSGTFNPFGKGDATVSYKIHNTGNAILSAQQAVSIAGPFGLLRSRAGKIAPPPDLLPGESWKVTVPIKGVAPTFSLGTTATLTPLLADPSGSTTSLTPVKTTSHLLAIPWGLLLLLVVLVAVIVGVVILVRRNRVQRKVREDARVREAVEKALHEQEKTH